MPLARNGLTPPRAVRPCLRVAHGDRAKHVHLLGKTAAFCVSLQTLKSLQFQSLRNGSPRLSSRIGSGTIALFMVQEYPTLAKWPKMGLFSIKTVLVYAQSFETKW